MDVGGIFPPRSLGLQVQVSSGRCTHSLLVIHPFTTRAIGKHTGGPLWGVGNVNIRSLGALHPRPNESNYTGKCKHSRSPVFREAELKAAWQDQFLYIQYIHISSFFFYYAKSIFSLLISHVSINMYICGPPPSLSRPSPHRTHLSLIVHPRRAPARLHISVTGWGCGWLVQVGWVFVIIVCARSSFSLVAC